MGSYGANRCGSHAALHGKVIAQPSRDRNRARFHRVSFDDPGLKVHVIQGDHHEQTSSRLSINPCVFGARRGGDWEGKTDLTSDASSLPPSVNGSGEMPNLGLTGG